MPKKNENKPLKIKRFVFNSLLALFTLLTYLAAYTSPERFYFLGFATFFIPFLLLAHILFIVYWLFAKAINALLSFFVLLLGFPFVQATFVFNWRAKSLQNSFTVLSYNVRVFNCYEHLEREKPDSPSKMIRWLAENKAEIKCVQEYYHLQHSVEFNTIREIAEKQKYAYHTTPMPALNDKKGFFGLAIFTKFPIINKGVIVFGQRNYEQGIFIDLQNQKDTIRVVNVHLQSMYIDEKNLLKEHNSYSETEKQYFELFRKLRKGFESRAKQIKILEEHLKKSPFPVILCGDLNDLPYSYTYQRLKKYLWNAFETAGQGFGFSYNGKIPFLRIDNQFYNKKLKANNFKTYSEISYSDHFPIEAEYMLK